MKLRNNPITVPISSGNSDDNKHRMPLFLTPEMEHGWILDDRAMTTCLNF